MANNKLLKEASLIDKLPEDILTAIERDKTSLGDNPAIPNIFGDKFIEKIANDRFSEVQSSLKQIRNIEGVSNDVEKALNELIIKCQEIERQNRDRLEKICLNHLIDLFDIPEDAIKLELSLVDNVEFNDDSFVVDPIETEKDFVYNDFNEIDTLSAEVLKRRLINAISAGASLLLSSDIKSFISDVYDIDPDLPTLYRQIIALNNYLLFTKNDIGITEQNKMEIGIVNVNLSGEDEKPIITAQGKIFPVLLSEAIKGLFELFASHGLPKDINLTKKILARADFIKAEPWDMRIGPGLWKNISNKLDNLKPEYIPYFLKILFSLKVEKFNEYMREILANTKKGKLIVNKISEKAINDKENDKFTQTMVKPNDKIGIINDEYIQENEL